MDRARPDVFAPSELSLGLLALDGLTGIWANLPNASIKNTHSNGPFGVRCIRDGPDVFSIQVSAHFQNFEKAGFKGQMLGFKVQCLQFTNKVYWLLFSRMVLILYSCTWPLASLAYMRLSVRV